MIRQRVPGGAGGGVTDHTLLTNIGTLSHAQLEAALTASIATIDTLAMTAADQGNVILGLPGGYANSFDSGPSGDPGNVDAAASSGYIYSTGNDCYDNRPDNTTAIPSTGADAIDEGAQADAQVSGAMDLTCWIKPGSSPTELFIGGHGYAESGDKYGQYGWSLTYGRYNSGQLSWTIADGADVETLALVGGAVSLSTEGYTHVRVSFVPSTSMTMWVNGTQLATVTTGVPAAITWGASSKLEIGRVATLRWLSGSTYEAQSWYNATPCDLRDLRVYNRTLSSAEAAAIYAGAGLDSVTAGRQLWLYETSAVAMTLQTVACALHYSPATAAVALLEADGEAGIVLNTDLVASLSRDGATWATATLVQSGAVLPSGRRILTCDPVAPGGTGTDILLKVETTAKALTLHAISVRAAQ